MMNIPYINLPDPRLRRATPPPMAMPNEDIDAAATAYQIPSYSRPQAEDPRSAEIARQAGISTDPDIPEINMGAADESLPAARPPVNIPHIALSDRPPVTNSVSIPESSPTLGIRSTPAIASAFTPQPPPHQPGSGWKARLGAIGRGALYGMGMGGQQGGGMGAIGGAVAGAITGGVSPKTIARWQTEGDQAKWRQTHELEEQDATRDVNRRNVEEDNRRLNEASRQKVLNDAAGRALQHEQITASSADRQANAQRLATAERERVAATAVQRAATMKQKVPMAAVRGTSLEAYGDMIPPDKMVVPHWEQNRAGEWVDLNSAKGPVQGKVPRDPTDITPAEIFRQKKEDERIAERDSKEEEQTKDKAEAALRRTQKLIDAHRLAAGTAGKKDGATAEHIQSAKDAALAAADELESSYPGLLEGGEGTGGFPYAKWKGDKRPPPQRLAPRSGSGGSAARAQTMTRSEYQQQVTKHGQAQVDEWLAKKGITVK